MNILLGAYLAGMIAWGVIHLDNWQQADGTDQRRTEARLVLLTPLWFVCIPVFLWEIINDARGPH